MTKLFSCACKHVVGEITHGCRAAVGWLMLSVELLHKSITGATTIPRGMERSGVCCAFRHVGYLVLQKRKRVHKEKKKREEERETRGWQIYIWYSLAGIFSKTEGLIYYADTRWQNMRGNDFGEIKETRRAQGERRNHFTIST